MATKITKKTNKKASKKIPHLYKEHAPDNHKITGKFVGLYIMMAIATIVFAAISVWMYFSWSDLLMKYEKIDPACRIGKCEATSPELDFDDEE